MIHTIAPEAVRELADVDDEVLSVTLETMGEAVPHDIVDATGLEIPFGQAAGEIRTAARAHGVTVHVVD